MYQPIDTTTNHLNNLSTACQLIDTTTNHLNDQKYRKKTNQPINHLTILSTCHLNNLLISHLNRPINQSHLNRPINQRPYQQTHQPAISSTNRPKISKNIYKSLNNLSTKNITTNQASSHQPINQNPNKSTIQPSQQPIS